MTERKDSPVKLHVGYVGRTRDGKRVEIKADPSPDGFHKFLSVDARGETFFVSECGRLYEGQTFLSLKDIIGPWEEPAQEPAKQEGGAWIYRGKNEKIPQIEVVSHKGMRGIVRADDVIWPNVRSYRIVEPAKPREWWISPATGEVNDHDDPDLGHNHKFIRVREVLE